MQKFYNSPTTSTPEIYFSQEENIFLIRGTSSPPDVREIYYPAIQWLRTFINDILEGRFNNYSSDFPFKFQTDLEYFNSSSAKFLFDIFSELKRLASSGIPVVVEWFYEEEDIDMKEAGSDIASLVEMEFTFIIKRK